MKVYNEEKTQILESYDLTKGQLIPSTITKEIPAVKEIKEISHYETIKEYANGGKDVKKVIDVEGRPYKEAYTESIDIMVYKPYTQKQLAEIEIDSLKNWFNEYYTQHEQKYRRLYTMRKTCDDGSDPYQQLMLLYQTAESNRKRIQELESQYGIE